jgi:hypothetical protein
LMLIDVVLGANEFTCPVSQVFTETDGNTRWSKYSISFNQSSNGIWVGVLDSTI